MRRNFDLANAIRPVALAASASEPPVEVVERAKRIFCDGCGQDVAVVPVPGWPEKQMLENHEDGVVVPTYGGAYQHCGNSGRHVR